MDQRHEQQRVDLAADGRQRQLPDARVQRARRPSRQPGHRRDDPAANAALAARDAAAAAAAALAAAPAAIASIQDDHQSRARVAAQDSSDHQL
jgi:hypothetical protein